MRTIRISNLWRPLAIGLAQWGSMQSSKALVVNAIADTWIRESNPTATYGDDLISVWDGLGSDQRRHGVVVFDLSATVGLNIESVFLQLFDRDDERSEESPLVQQAFLFNPTPPQLLNDPSNIPSLTNLYTWEEYVTFDEASLLPLESLGAYNIAAGDTVNGYETSGFATPGDISTLIQQRNNNSNIVAFVLQAAEGERDWGDIEFDGTAPRLVFNEAPPVLGDFSNNGMVGIEDYMIMIDPANWLQSVPPGTLGDIDNNGFVDLDDFSAFKPIYQAATGASLDLGGHHAVPEPAGWVLLAVALFGLAIRMGTARLAAAKVAVGLALATLLVPNTASAVTVTESYDSWIRDEGLTVEGRNADWIGVYNSAGGNGRARWGVLEFDLSGVGPLNLDQLHMGFWRMAADSPVGSSDNFPSKQTVSLITETGATTDISAFTWEQLNDPGQVTLTPFESLGAIELVGLAANPGEANRYHFGAASAADMALIQPLINSGGKLRVVVRSEESETAMRIDWGDGPDDGGAEHGESAILLINEAPPEFVPLTLQINTTTGEMTIRNPGIDPAVNTMFDIDGYVIQSPAGALRPAEFTGLSGEGEAGWQIVAPSASALSETNLSGSTLLDEGTEFSLGNAYTPGAAADPELTFKYSIAGVVGSTLGAVEFVSDVLNGDYNLDGVVDARDYTLWRNTFGSTTDLRADGNNNQSIDPEDYVIWKDNYGKTSAAAVAMAPASVPEPATALVVGLLATVGGGLGTKCRRRKAA